jgi:hypothetical protein
MPIDISIPEIASLMREWKNLIYKHNTFSNRGKYYIEGRITEEWGIEKKRIDELYRLKIKYLQEELANKKKYAEILIKQENERKKVVAKQKREERIIENKTKVTPVATRRSSRNQEKIVGTHTSN